MVAYKRTFTFTALPLTKYPHSPGGPQSLSPLKMKKKRKEKFVILEKRIMKTSNEIWTKLDPLEKPSRKAKHGDNIVEKIGMSEKK